MIRPLAILALLLGFMLTARGDGIWSGGGVIGVDGIANQGAVGVQGINAISATAKSSPVVGCVGTGFNFTLACNSQYISVF